MVEVGVDGEIDESERCGRRRWAAANPMKGLPIRGVITMLPPLRPTQTVSLSVGSMSASPHSRIQWHRYSESPPAASSTSVSRTSGTQRSSSMLGSAVSSSNPTDFHPNWVICDSSRPLTNPHGFTPGPTCGWPYCAVGMHSALHSSIGLPSMVDERVVDARVVDTGRGEK